MRSGVVEHSAAVSIESPLGGATGGGGASIAVAAARSRIDATIDHQTALIEKSAVASTVDGPRGGWGV